MARRLAAASATAQVAKSAQDLHELLLNATLSESRLPRVRAPALAPDGTPVAYSLKIDTTGDPPPFRMIVEPGTLAVSVSEQVEICEQLTFAALSLLGWQAASLRLERALELLLPGDRRSIDDWWGGAWSGLEARGEKLELRLYVNLRDQDLPVRWQQLQRLAALLGVQGLEEVAFLSAPYAQPTGICLSLSNGQVRGFRVYVTFENAATAHLTAVCPPAFRSEHMAGFCDGFIDLFGCLPRQGASVAYDFRCEAGLARVKVELCCELLDSSTQNRVLPWLVDRLPHWKVPNQALIAFLEDFRDCFGDAVAQYVSLGLSVDSHHFTAYCRPAELGAE